MKVLEIRGNMRLLNKQMKRARHLYVLLIKKSIEEEGTFALKRAAEYAQQKRLWLTPAIRDIQFAILRIMFKLEGLKSHNQYCWLDWLDSKGWKLGCHGPIYRKAA